METHYLTRINCVPVHTLCDKHLLAEHRELTRIPNCVLKGRYNLSNQPLEYTLGTGHVKFFYTRLKYLHLRYIELNKECAARGFNVVNKWPTDTIPSALYNDWTPTAEAIVINQARIDDRIKTMTNVKWTNPTN